MSVFASLIKSLDEALRDLELALWEWLKEVE
jgi:hypothetical protein